MKRQQDRIRLESVKFLRPTKMLPVLYGCETWSFTVREGHRLMVFENWMLGRIFGP
jgi:hypothetical protein